MKGKTKENKEEHTNTPKEAETSPQCFICNGRGYFRDRTTGIVQTCWKCLEEGRLK